MRAILAALAGLMAATATADPPVVAVREAPRAVDVRAWIRGIL